MAAQRVLISTIAARAGGVPVMVRFAVSVLRELGAEPVIAYYEPYSLNPALSVPAFALGRRRPGCEQGEAMESCETYAIGAWLPELEFTTYRLHRHWQKVVDSCSAHVAVSGNILAALPLAMRGVPHLAWIASDWHGDRADRARSFGPARRLLDSALVQPVMNNLERRLLRAGHILALSQFTSRELQRVARLTAPPVCPTPVDIDGLHPTPQAVVPGQVVFSGRVDDPRKNFNLLLNAMALLRQRGRDYRLVVCGGQLSPASSALLDRLHLADRVRIAGYLTYPQLVATVAASDVFALPSRQEGLCISALEAMACGVPVIATRCGGPEEFVRPEVNGELVGFAPEHMAEAIDRVVTDRARRDRYSSAARTTVEQHYSPAVANAALRSALLRVFPALSA